MTQQRKSIFAFIVALLSVGIVPAYANVPGGGTGTGGNVTVTDNGGTVVLANGIVSFTINKSNGNVTNFTYNGSNLLSGGNGGGSLYFDGSGGPSLANPVYTLIVNPANNGGNQGEVWLQSTADPMDMAIYYDLLRGQQGIYNTMILTHQAGYADYPGAELRSNVYVGSQFNWLAVDPYRFRQMASPGDSSVSVTGAPKEVTQWTSGIYNGLTECKYAYSDPLGELDTWGWASTTTANGIWQVLPSHEYYDGGPMHRELTEHIGNTLLNMFGGGHYGFGLSQDQPAGSFSSKTFGPAFIYANKYTGSASDPASMKAQVLWTDAKAQAAAEQGAWPYTWFNPQPVGGSGSAYPQSNARGTVSGTFAISDSGNPGASPVGMWIGLAPVDGGIDFQQQYLTYQFWVKTGSGGSFTIPNVLPGTYNLWAFGPGAAGTFEKTNVTVAAGQVLGLGTVTWTPPRLGPTVWEIGTPDRNSNEFHNGEHDVTPYSGVLPPYAGGAPYNSPTAWGAYMAYPSQFPNGVSFVVGTSNYANNWNYCQPTVPNGSGGYTSSTSKIFFNLATAPSASQSARLYMAFASDYSSACILTINGTVQTASVMGSTNGNYATIANATTGFFPPNHSFDSILRLGSEGAWGDAYLNFPGTSLRAGTNEIDIAIRPSGTAGLGQGFEYDYLRLELTGFNSTNPTNTPSRTPTASATNTPAPPTATFTRTNTPVPPTATFTATLTKTNTPVPPTATFTSIATNTSTRTNTPIPPTSTFTRTFTPSFTSTFTPVPPTNTFTNTPVPPTSTFTRTSTPTFTNSPVPPTSTFTNTAVPPTSTFTRTSTPSFTSTLTPVPPTNTSTKTLTPTSTFTNSPIPPTSTFTNTPVPPTATFTFSSTRTNTPVPPTNTNTPVPPSFTPTSTNSPVPPTRTATFSSTSVPPTATNTNSPVPATPTNTPMPTNTNTPVPPTFTPTAVPPTATNTNSPVPPTSTNTPLPPTSTATLTNTPVPPTATFTNSPMPLTPTFTHTPVLPTSTSTRTMTPSFTSTSTPVPPSATFTAVPPSATFTSSMTPTATPTHTPVPPTNTLTPIPPTATPTASNTSTPTRTPTPMPPTATPTAVPTSSSFVVQLLSGVTSDGTNSPHPQIQIVNTGTGPLNLNNVQVKYWFNCDCANQTIQAWVDWAGLVPAGSTVTGNVQISAVATALGGQTNYILYAFTGNMVLQPGQSIQIQSRFNKSDWSNMLQSNDWSFASYTSFTNWTHVTGYQNGTLVWGQEPVATTSALNVVNAMVFPNPSSGNGTSLTFNLVGGTSTQTVSPTGASPVLVDPNVKVTLKIYTTAFRQIWSQSLTGPSYGTTGEHVVPWDEKDGNGSMVANGVYLLRVTVDSHGQNSSALAKILILK